MQAVTNARFVPLVDFVSAVERSYDVPYGVSAAVALKADHAVMYTLEPEKADAVRFFGLELGVQTQEIVFRLRVDNNLGFLATDLHTTDMYRIVMPKLIPGTSVPQNRVDHARLLRSLAEKVLDGNIIIPETHSRMLAPLYQLQEYMDRTGYSAPDTKPDNMLYDPDQDTFVLLDMCQHAYAFADVPDIEILVSD